MEVVLKFLQRQKTVPSLALAYRRCKEGIFRTDTEQSQRSRATVSRLKVIHVVEEAPAHRLFRFERSRAFRKVGFVSRIIFPLTNLFKHTSG